MTETGYTLTLDPEALAGSTDETAVLASFLDYYRSIMVRKLAGVSEEDARRRLVRSDTTLGGLVKHLRWVELNWFQRVLSGRTDAELPAPPWTEEDPDADFRLADDETVESVLADYLAECEESRRLAAGRALTDTGTHRRAGPTTLFWIYVHMIEETARHAGHADILREQIDGTTGD